MVADLDKIEWVDGGIHNIQRVGFRKGLHKLSVGVGFADQVRMAHPGPGAALGLFALGRLHVRSGEPQFQRPHFVLRP